MALHDQRVRAVGGVTGPVPFAGHHKNRFRRGVRTGRLGHGWPNARGSSRKGRSREKGTAAVDSAGASNGWSVLIGPLIDPAASALCCDCVTLVSTRICRRRRSVLSVNDRQGYRICLGCPCRVRPVGMRDHKCFLPQLGGLSHNAGEIRRCRPRCRSVQHHARWNSADLRGRCPLL